MSEARFHWFLPTQGDGRALIETGGTGPTGVAGGLRDSSISYLTRIATAAEDLGFEAALTPTGAWCDDAWMVTAMLSETSERLKFLIAFRPGMVSPTLAAQMAATFQWHSGGRLLLNVVTGGDADEQRASATSLPRTTATGARGSSWRSSAGSGKARRSTSPASTCGLRERRSPACPTRRRRSTSAVPPPPPERSRLPIRTST